MPNAITLSAAALVVIAMGSAPSAATPPPEAVACLAFPDAAHAALARQLCAAVEAAVDDRLTGAASDQAPLVVEVTALRRNGFDARLGWRVSGQTVWGPVLTSSSVDAGGIAPGAADALAGALLKVTPVPATILSPAFQP